MTSLNQISPIQLVSAHLFKITFH